MTNKVTNFLKSDEYRKRIHDLIPGGAHTYSKGDDQFPLRSPAAIVKGKGVYVWDLDGNKYLDCSMGLTSVSLGHAYEPIIAAVRAELENGVNFQRPSVLERTTAEAFLELVPCHQMIKFTKNGSTATTAAVKLSRAYTGRTMVAFPGDHPFYSYDDWFIGKTLCGRGVPETQIQFSATFESHDLGSLEKLFAQYPDQIACVISEPERPLAQDPNYLKKLIEICHKNGALFIQDEMITGFKTDFPGSIKKYGVVPDLATWGKGIANGFSFCALTGKKEIMELGGIRNIGAEKVFLTSTTHGGETHALAAAIATIEVFKTQDVITHNHSIGQQLINSINEVIKKKNLQKLVEISSINWMQLFTFKNKEEKIDSGFRTLFLQEMIARGVLFQGAFVPCFSHQKSDVDYFVEAFSESCDVYIEAIEKGWEKYLIGNPTKPVFRKYL